MPSVDFRLPYQILSFRVELNGGWDLMVLTPFGPLQIVKPPVDSLPDSVSAIGSVPKTDPLTGPISDPISGPVTHPVLDAREPVQIAVTIDRPAGMTADTLPAPFETALIQLAQSILMDWESTKWISAPFRITIAEA